MARWGIRPLFDLKGKNRDPSVTNIRNVASPHGVAGLNLRTVASCRLHRSQDNEVLPDGVRSPVWLAFDESRPLAFFAGLWTCWSSVRKVKVRRDD
jgi:hypothetical protein